MDGKSAFIFMQNGSIIFAGFAKDKDFCSSKEVEAKAILCVLSIVRERGFHSIQVFFDALEVVNTISGSDDWPLRSIVSDIHELSKSFRRVDFNFVPRNFNQRDHESPDVGLNSSKGPFHFILG